MRSDIIIRSSYKQVWSLKIKMESTCFAFIGTAKGEKGISALGVGERLAGIHSALVHITCSLTGTAG